MLGLLRHGRGRLALYGDSNCLDSSHQRGNCHDLLLKLLAFAGGGSDELLTPDTKLNATFGSLEGLPARRDDYNFTEVSRVLSEPIRCYANAPLAFQGRALLQAPPAAAAVQEEPARGSGAAAGGSTSRKTAEEGAQEAEGGEEGGGGGEAAGDREHPDLDTLAQGEEEGALGGAERRSQ